MKLEENNVYFRFDKSKLVSNFNEYSRLGNIYYPIKANSSLNVLQAMKELNSGFCITTLDNFEKVKKLSIDSKKICIINVLSGNETLKYYYDAGVRFFTFDDMNSLMEFSKYADLSTTKIVIRLSTMQIFDDEFSHLGASLEEALQMIKFLMGKCNDYGIAFYIQNNLKYKENVLEKIFNYILEKYSNLGLKFANIGGISLLGKSNEELLAKFKSELNLKEIVLEIGRDLVENTIELETTIIRDKIINGKKLVIIKNGLYSGFFDVVLHNRKFDMHLKLKNNKEIKIFQEKQNESDAEFILCGGSADSSDKLGTMYIDLQYTKQLEKGNIITIKNTGAYFEEFFMTYGNDLNKVYL